MIGGSRRGIQVLDPPSPLYFFFITITFHGYIQFHGYPFFPFSKWLDPCLNLLTIVTPYISLLFIICKWHPHILQFDRSFQYEILSWEMKQEFFSIFFFLVLTLYGNILSGNCHIYNEAEKQLHHCTLWGLLMFWIFKAWQHFI